jgi:hypothetical protein
VGRARTQTDAVVDGFTAVLGTRRGSALAQAQRDIVESQQREVALGGFLKTIAGITSGSGFEIEEGLAQAYRQKEPVQSVASTLLRKLQASKTLALMSSRLHIVAAVADSGDPALCPGLTKPALIALCDYLTWLAEEDNAVAYLTRSSVNALADVVVRRSFLDRDLEEAYCRRLQPLCEVLGAFLARPGNKDDTCPGENMAIVLRDASFDVLQPLRSWIEAFALRYDEESLTARERQLLLSAVHESAFDPEVARAFAPLTQRFETG